VEAAKSLKTLVPISRYTRIRISIRTSTESSNFQSGDQFPGRREDFCSFYR